MRIAALTMAYNEPVWAPVWARFYSRQVGPKNCFLMDHGSDDGSTDGLGITVERLARTPLDEDARAGAVSARAAELLRSYDAVVHTDVDELVFADPGRHVDLAGFARSSADEVVTTAGLDLQHLPGEERPLDASGPIGAQRRWVRFSGAMCKPAFVRRRVRWDPGFHRCDAPLVFGGLYLLHLRYADLALGLQRLGKTRDQAFADAATNLHQRVTDHAFVDMVGAIARLPREVVELEIGREPLAGWLERVRAGQADGGGWLSLAGETLWRLPDQWRRLLT